MINNKKKNDDYYFWFKGGKINKADAKLVSFSLFVGTIGIIFAFILQVEKRTAYIIILFFVVVGFVVGNRIFKKKT